MPRTEIVLGIDLGGTETKIGLISFSGEVLQESSFKTGAKAPFEAFLENLQLEVNKLLAKAGRDISLTGIGIGAPNANFRTGNMENPPNFKWGKNIPIVDAIQGLFDLPVYLANDANAAAIGQMEFGLAKGMKNFLVITLGTGLGSGIVVDGKLLTGAHGMAGELGHISINPHGRTCNCGLPGCLETYASVTGMKRTVFRLLADMSDSSPLRKINFEEMTGVQIANAALAGDPIAVRAFEITGEILGDKLADAAAFLDPEAIILTGGLTKAGDLLINPVRKSMEKNLFFAYRGKIKLLAAQGTAEDAILGAAALVLKEQKINPALL